MDNQKNWPIKNLGTIKRIAHGADSVVHTVTPKDSSSPEFITKVYGQEDFGKLNPQEQEEILTNYYRDTIKAQEILQKNDNPLNQTFSINGQEYPLSYRIAPQGGAMFRDEEKTALFGQEYIDGLNLSDLHLYTDLRGQGVEIKENQKVFLGNRALCWNLYNEVTKIFKHISKSMDIYFEDAIPNVKPFLDTENGKIIIVITDLASSLTQSYKRPDKNPKI